MLINTKQKVAVLASGLAIASTGFVSDAQASETAKRQAAQPQGLSQKTDARGGRGGYGRTDEPKPSDAGVPKPA
jgi:hypothetical protein